MEQLDRAKQTALDEEEDFLRELRALAGMDGAPAAEEPAPQPAAPQPEPKKAEAPAAEAPQPESPLRMRIQPREAAPVETPAPARRPAPQPIPDATQKVPSPREAFREERPAPRRAPAEPATQTAPRDGIPGWVTGLLILLLSAAILTLTVLGVWRGLQG